MAPSNGSQSGSTGGVRIQKVLSAAGVSSRRAAEDLIRQGRVTVNGRKAELGRRVDPASDRVEVDGERVAADPGKRYLVLNKPAGVITTRSDPQKRPTVMDLVSTDAQVYPVGRLDAATEGLLLLTNDGEVAHRLAHPSYEVSKVYLAEVEGLFDAVRGARLIKSGIRIDESARKAKAEKVRVLGTRSRPAPASILEVTVHEGRNHVVRKMLEATGHPVKKLVRTAVGPLKLGHLRPGEHRELTPREIASLYRAVGL